MLGQWTQPFGTKKVAFCITTRHLWTIEHSYQPSHTRILKSEQEKKLKVVLNCVVFAINYKQWDKVTPHCVTKSVRFGSKKCQPSSTLDYCEDAKNI